MERAKWLNARNAWAGLGLGIVAYEIASPKGELLSEGADRAIEKHPVLTRLAIGAVALHLMNVLPERIDPVHRIATILRK